MNFPKLSDAERAARLSIPTGRLRLIIDTDTKNEVDDQFAIAWAMQSTERFQIEALYAAPFSHDCFRQFNTERDTAELANSINGHSEDPGDGMEQSYQEIKNILRLMELEPEGKVFRGSTGYLPDCETFVESEAARDLVHRAMSAEEPLYVAAIGAATNIASAILMEPAIIQKIVVVWLGGHPLSFGHGVEFNLIQDVHAAQVLFDCGVPMVFVPCMNVASMLTVAEDELRARLLGKSKIGTYLSELCLEAFQNPEAAIAMMMLNRTSNLRGREDQSEEYLRQFPTKNVAWSRIIWDIATIGYLKNPNWTPSMLVPSPVLNDEFTYGTAPGRHAIRIVTYCHRDMIFGDLFAALSGE